MAVAGGAFLGSICPFRNNRSQGEGKEKKREGWEGKGLLREARGVDGAVMD